MDSYKNEVEEILEDLSTLNLLYNREYINIQEFSTIRDRMLQKMIAITKKETTNTIEDINED